MLGAIAASFAMIASAQAAMLVDVKGNIKVNRGNGFEKAASELVVKPGYKLMAAPGASAKVVYSNGVAFKLQSGRVMTVMTDELAKIRSTAMYQEPVVAPVPPIPTPLVIGGLVAAGGLGIAAAAGAFGGDDDGTPSP